MPHSGGGGSHGGGSHGGSSGGSGGSSHRTSKNYFPGSTRYRRHYYDGREDDYFYSDAVPRKTGMTGIVILLCFASIFMAMLIPNLVKTSPKKLKENYVRPESRIIDNIDIIDNGSELEKVLEEYNDITGICPVVYTMYVEDYKDSYEDLEAFAYKKYLDLFSDERHYLLVYAIPEDQADRFRSGDLKVPDYYWESMIGDDTDALYNEKTFVREVQNGFESGGKPGEVFSDAVKNMSDYDTRLMSKRFHIKSSGILPLLIAIGLFSIPLVSMIRNHFKEKTFEYEEVPFTEEDMALRSSVQQKSTPQMTPKQSRLIRIITIIFMIPFVLSGIGFIFGGIFLTLRGDGGGLFMLMFGLIWTASVCAFLIPVFLATKKKKDDDDDEDRYDRGRDYDE